MRTIKINESISITIEALTRRGIEALKEKGFQINTISIYGITAEQADEFFDQLIRSYCPDDADRAIDALKDVPQAVYRDVSKQLIAETWGSRDEEKNLPRSGSGLVQSPDLN